LPVLSWSGEISTTSRPTTDTPEIARSSDNAS
jgi:hypothetical protein